MVIIFLVIKFCDKKYCPYICIGFNTFIKHQKLKTMETTKSIHITSRNIKGEYTINGSRFTVKHNRLNNGEPIVFELDDKDYDGETRFFTEEQLYYDLDSRFDLELVRFDTSAKNYILQHFHFISEDELPDCCKLYTVEELKKYFTDYDIEDAQLNKLEDDDDYSILHYNKHYEYYVRRASKPGLYELDICDC